MVDRKHRDFTEEDIQKLADTFEAFQNGTLEDGGEPRVFPEGSTASQTGIVIVFLSGRKRIACGSGCLKGIAIRRKEWMMRCRTL